MKKPKSYAADGHTSDPSSTLGLSPSNYNPGKPLRREALLECPTAFAGTNAIWSTSISAKAGSFLSTAECSGHQAPPTAPARVGPVPKTTRGSCIASALGLLASKSCRNGKTDHNHKDLCFVSLSQKPVVGKFQDTATAPKHQDPDRLKLPPLLPNSIFFSVQTPLPCDVRFSRVAPGRFPHL